MFNKIKTITGIIFLGTFLCAASAGASISLLSTFRLSEDPADKPIPAWSGGALVVIEGFGSQIPSIDIFDNTGARTSSTPVVIPGASFVDLSAAVHGTDGMIAACGTALDNQGRRASFIFVSAPGKPVQLVRTGQYTPYQIALASDGTLWTAGIDALDRRPANSQDPASVISPYLSSSVLRHFDPRGNPLGGAVAQSTIQSFANLFGLHNQLVASGNLIAWYCPAEGRYVQIATHGTIADISGIAPPTVEASISGLAITPNGSVYLTGGNGSPAVSTLYSLNKTTKIWDVLQQGRSYMRLYGTQGANLVSGTGDRFVIQFLGLTE
jgi:hypothetical protein